MAAMRRRAKSNTLFRLVKSLSFGQFTKLKAFNDVYAKGSKQWRLIEYYYHLDEWSREKETSDWPDGRFSALKYDTLQWLLRAMSRVGDWPGNALFHVFGDVSMALKHKVFESAADFWEEAKPMVLKQERFGLQLEFLSLQRETIRLGYLAEEIPENLAENLKMTQIALSLQSELLTLEIVRSKYFDPIKILHAQDGTVPRELSDLLDKELKKIRYETLKGIRARFCFLRMQVFLDLLSGLAKAETSISKLIDLQVENAWLREDDLGRFFMDVRSAVFVFSAIGDHKRVRKLMALFGLYEFQDPWVFSVGVVAKIECQLWAGLFLKDPSQTEVGLASLKDGFPLIKRECSKTALIRILHYAAIAELNLGNPKSANRWLEELLNCKAIVKEDRISSARVMQLMCLLCTEDDATFLEGKANTVVKNLRRTNGQYPQLQKVALAIGRLARCGDDQNCKTKEIKRLIQELAEGADTDKDRFSADHFDYALWFEELLEKITIHQ